MLGRRLLCSVLKKSQLGRWKVCFSSPQVGKKMVKDFVDNIISSNKVAVFSKSYCPFCTRVKSILKEAGLKDFFVVELDQRSDCDAIQDYLKTITGGRTVPRVFVGGKFIGGCDDTDALFKSGELQVKLKEAKAL